MADLSITIRENDLIVKDGEKFIVSKKGEEALARFYELKRRVYEVDKKIREYFTKKMKEEKISSIEGEKVKVIRRFYGQKYKIVNEKEALEKGFAKTRIVPDSEAIEVYVEETGKLPDGIELNDKRQERVIISLEK